MKFTPVVALTILLVACSGGVFPGQAAPKPTLTAIDVYMNETSDYYESLAASTITVKNQLAADQKDLSLFDDQNWRMIITKALNQIRKDYHTVSTAPPPQGIEAYHQAMIQAEAHTDHAASLLLAWLNDKDPAKLSEATGEFAAADAGLKQAQAILDTLLRK